MFAAAATNAAVVPFVRVGVGAANPALGTTWNRARYTGRGGFEPTMPKYLVVLRDFGNFAANQLYGEDTPRRIARYMIHCNATEQMELPLIPSSHPHTHSPSPARDCQLQVLIASAKSASNLQRRATDCRINNVNNSNTGVCDRLCMGDSRRRSCTCCSGTVSRL